MNPNLSLRQLRAFDAVADEASFTRAAERLFLTQSALSVLVREMERELGLQLFDRHTRRVELTEAGRTLHPQVRRILNELGTAVDGVLDLRDKRKGVLRLAAPQLMAGTLVPAVLAVYRQRHPGVEIRLLDTVLERLPEHLRAGDAELAIGPDGVLDQAGLHRRPFLRDSHWLVCRPDDPLAALKTVSWRALGGRPFIAPTRDFVSRMRTLLGPHAEPVLQAPWQEVSFFTTAFGLVSAGLGITLSPSYAHPLVHAHGLLMRPMGRPALVREVSVYSLEGKALSPAAASLLECLDEVVAAQRRARPG